MHLTFAQIAARSGSSDDAHGHLDEADRIAQRVGERNALRRHFGPTNIACWRVAVGIELGEGARAYADATRLFAVFSGLLSVMACVELLSVVTCRRVWGW